jgi:hypothetical protein
MVAVHHAPYSLDAIHGGHPEVDAALDRAIAASSKIPTIVLADHVHNCQRFRATSTRWVAQSSRMWLPVPEAMLVIPAYIDRRLVRCAVGSSTPMGKTMKHLVSFE